MRRYLTIIIVILLAYTRTAYASPYYSVNFDVVTTAAMTGAYTNAALEENSAYSDLKEILKHYTKASVATAGIFGVKALDRQAMINARGFGSAEENYYYKRIYQLVAAEITPRLLTIAVMSVKHPEKALYWGPYLFRTTEQVRQLCEQFSSIVTNGKITFSDLVFFSMSDTVRDIFDLAQYGNVDWKAMLNQMGSFASGFTKEDLMEEITNLADLGSNIAGAGYDTFKDAFSTMGDASKDLLTGKAKKMYEGYKEFREVSRNFSNPTNVRNLILSRIGGTDSLAAMKLFKPHHGLDMAKYVFDYFNQYTNQYYRQTYYIQTIDKGTDIVYDYVPAKYTLDHIYDSNWKNSGKDFTQGGEWYFAEWPGHKEPIDFSAKSKQNTINFTGWSQDRVNQMNREQTGDRRYEYSIVFPNYIVDRNYEDVGSGWNKWPYGGHGAYSVRVTRYHEWTMTYYEETYDSYKTPLSSFEARMEQKLNEANNNQTYTNSDGNEVEVENPYVYKIVKGPKVYYSESDARKMAGCAYVNYISNCESETRMGDGSITWKENGDHDHSDINDDSRRYAMETTLSDDSESSEIDEKIDEIQQRKDAKNQELTNLRSEQMQLQEKINSSSYNDQKPLREKYNENTKRIEELKNEIAEINQELSSANAARQEIIDDKADELDGLQRIPSLIHQFEEAYKITWTDEGSWANAGKSVAKDTYTRKGKISSMDNTEVVFTAELSTTRSESHFLGIRTHRAILQVEYHLSDGTPSQSTVDVLQLDPNLSDVEKSELANARLHELNEQLEPEHCTVTMEYHYADPTQVDNDEDVQHLLWVSDRLEIAREIEYKLSKINAQLIIFEKFMRQRESILTYLKREIFGYLDAERMDTAARRAYYKWKCVFREVSKGVRPKDVVIEDEEDEIIQ